MRNPLNAIESTALPDPELLLSKIAAGDRDALAQLYSQTRTAVYAAALGVLRNAHDAQDITQQWNLYVPSNLPVGSSVYLSCFKIIVWDALDTSDYCDHKVSNPYPHSYKDHTPKANAFCAQPCKVLKFIKAYFYK